MPKAPLQKGLSSNISHPEPTGDKPVSAKSMPLNFKVPADFRREFKTYAAQHNKKMNELLFEAFAALKEKHAE